MRLGFRLLLGYFLIVGLAAFTVLNVFVGEVKPGVRQTMEDTLIDTAHLLAEMAVDDVRDGTLAAGGFARHWAAYRARSFNASVWGFRKHEPGFRVYITDPKGIVLFDSENRAVGRDYSRWNDVYLTLRGGYGVRTSAEYGLDGEQASVMHVAAPIRDGDRLLGVLTVAKSNRSVQPFIERSQNKIIRAGVWLLAASLLIGVLAALWLTLSVRRLVTYADAVTRGERATLPRLTGGEIRRLGEALESMRVRLEGKHYVERYVTTLTHEMKSPLAAIAGAAELLQEDMPEPQRRRFVGHVRDQAQRLRLLIDTMLAQAMVEQRRALEAPTAVDLAELVRDCVHAAEPKASARGVRFETDLEPGADAIEAAGSGSPPAGPSTGAEPAGGADGSVVHGDAFLLRQALANLIDNAVDFSPAGGTIDVRLRRRDGRLELAVRDRGPGVPDYALDRVFERFYSLPRPDGGAKSTGLGLSFVREVAELHGGEARLSNAGDGGARAVLVLP